MNAIPDLISAGVTSFKIEGRYKGIDYVKNVTATFRQAIDRFINDHSDYRRSSSGVSELAFSPDPDKTFNRGYTQYFIAGTKGKVASVGTQKSIGQHVGAITGMGKDFFRMAGHGLQNGDGLCFFTKQGELAGFGVDRVDKENVYPGNMKGLEVGTALYRNHDVALSRILKKSSARRRIGVEMDFIQEDTHIRLVVRDEDGNQAEIFKDVLFGPPRDPTRARQQIETHLSSTGNTPYQVTDLTIPQKPGFLPMSALNGIRRDVLEMLTRIRLEKYPCQTIQFIPNNAPYPEKKLDFRANVVNEHARQFYKRHGTEIIEPAFEALSDTTGKTVMTTRYCIRHQLDLCPKHNQSSRSPKEPLRISDKHHTYRLAFDCRQCRMLVILEGNRKC
jgi:putative protease